MADAGKSGRWEWIERASLFVGMILGATAFYWQLQERAADRKENLLPVYARVETARDSLYIISLDLLNIGKRTTHIRSVSLSKSAQHEGDRPRVQRLELDPTGHLSAHPAGLLLRMFEDSAGALQLDPNSSRRFVSDPITLTNLKLIADSGYVAVSTLRQDLEIRIDSEPLHNAVLAAVLVERARGFVDQPMRRKR
jgi:hypothetical protein